MSENAVLAALRRMGYAKEDMDRSRLPQHGIDAPARAGMESSGSSSASSHTLSETRERCVQFRGAHAGADAG